MSATAVASRVSSGLSKLAGPASNFGNEESGAVLAEYAILLSLVTAAMLATIFGLGGAVEANLEEAAEAIGKRKGPACPEPAQSWQCQ